MLFDVVIVGSGPVGCILAERLSSQLKLKCLIIERRNNIGGNCYDVHSKSGILYHKYGPHYFRSSNIELINYLKKFTKFHNANYEVKSYVNSKLYNFPINLTTLNEFFNTDLDASNMKKLLKKKRIKFDKLDNFENYLLSKIGKDLYESFYKNYTLKQWNIHPSLLPASVAKRIPIRFDSDNRYVNEKFQIMPSKGFTEMFNNMLDSKLITIKLNTDYFKCKNLNPKYFTIYTGPIDKYFNYKYGKLGWRSLKFKFEEHKTKFKQPYVQINYPNDYKFTRKVEIKHVTKQNHNMTIISKEYPTYGNEPYYPVNTIEDKIKFKKYLKLSKSKKNVHFVGRLAEYTYINTDQAMERALNLFEKIKKNLS